MTHYRMLDRAPSVAIMSNRNELKVYQGNIVYLNNGDNFELKFFNPLQEKIGVEIIFNGVKKGDSYLVLNPGQEVLLDRFLDEKRKMLFETYVIDGNNDEAVKAIENNGDITFNFYKEYYRHNYNHTYDDYDIKIKHEFPKKPYYNNYNYNVTYTGGSGNSNVTYTGLSGTSGASGISGASGVSGTGGSAGYGGGTTTNANSRIYSSPGVYISEKDLTSTSNYFSQNATFTSTSTFDQDYWFPINDSESSLSIDSLETGRIESGDISDQNLRSVNAQFSTTPFKTISYKLLPYSAMNKTIGEIRQYCTSCGYRIRKSSWHYCPKCGSELE